MQLWPQPSLFPPRLSRSWPNRLSSVHSFSLTCLRPVALTQHKRAEAAVEENCGNVARGSPVGVSAVTHAGLRELASLLRE